MAKAPVKEKAQPGKAVMSWQDKLKEDAARQAAMEQSSGGGKFFTMRAGVLKYDDVALPGNQIAAIVLHGIYENTYYDTAFDADARTPPACFAFWDDNHAEEMQPHSIVDEDTETFTRQNDVCDGCPQNEWGSAERGKGKACSNRRRLAIIPAGTYVSLGKGKGHDLQLFDDADTFKKADLGFMKIPVTSVKGYSAYVREVSEALGKSLWGVFTRVWLEPDDKSQFKVCFELLEEIPDELMEVVYKRHMEAVEAIEFPYRPQAEDDNDAAPVKNNASKKLAGKAAPAKKTPPKRR